MVIFDFSNQHWTLAMIHKKKKIIKELTPLFWERGFKSFKIDDVAKELRVSKRTVYALFKDKKGLIKEIIQNELDIFMQIIENARSQKNYFENILMLLENMVKYKSIPDQIKNNRELKKYYKDIYHLYRQGINHNIKYTIKNLIDRGKREGIIDDDIIRDDVANLFADTYILYTCEENINKVEDSEEMINALILLYMKGVLNEKGITQWKRYSSKIFDALEAKPPQYGL